MQATTVVLGIGNTLLGDEGVGVHAVARLHRDHAHRQDIRFLDGGTLSFTLAVPLCEAQRLVILDAAELNASPGTVRLFEGDELDAYLNAGARRSVHEVGLLDLMAIARLTHRLPSWRALIGVQPASVDWSETPTAAVSAAIPQVCDMTMALLKRWSLRESA